MTSINLMVLAFVWTLVSAQQTQAMESDVTGTSSDAECVVSEGNGVIGILHALSYEFEGLKKSSVNVEVSHDEYRLALCLLSKSNYHFRSFVIEDGNRRLVRLKLIRNTSIIVGYDLFSGIGVKLRHGPGYRVTAD